MMHTGTHTFLNLEEAASCLGLHPHTLQERAKAKIIPGNKVGKEWRFIDTELVEYLRAERHKNKEAACPSIEDRSTKSGGSASRHQTADQELCLLIEMSPAQRNTSLPLISERESHRRKPGRLSPGWKASHAASTNERHQADLRYGKPAARQDRRQFGKRSPTKAGNPLPRQPNGAALNLTRRKARTAKPPKIPPHGQELIKRAISPGK
jgi:excisionase family DNA binding protein